MFRRLVIDNVRYTPANEHDIESGLLGFACCTINDTLRLDGLAVRLTRHGRLAISFPAHCDGRGRQRFPIRPLNDRARREIERQLFRALDLNAGRW